MPRESKIATIRGVPNDIEMFEKTGISIAMGQFSGEVKSTTIYKTTSSEEGGFALAVERFVLANRLAGYNQFFSQSRLPSLPLERGTHA